MNDPKRPYSNDDEPFEDGHSNPDRGIPEPWPPEDGETLPDPAGERHAPPEELDP